MSSWHTFSGINKRDNEITLMLSLQDFNVATFKEKCDMVNAHADYLAVRRLGNCKIYLYQTREFFIEVYYSPAYKNVLMVNGFNDNSGLYPYTENISIADLESSY